MLLSVAALSRAIASDATGEIAAIVVAVLKALAGEKKQKLRDAMQLAFKEGGVKTLEIRSRKSGGADVRIDDGKWIYMTTREATLLDVAAFGSEPAADGFPAWQLHDSVALRIEQKSGKRPNKHTINEVVRLLRRRLSDKDLNPGLLQTGPSGLRFLLRR